MQQNLRPYWQRNNKPVSTMLDEAEHDYAALEARGVAFDRELTDDLTKSAGAHYAWLCTLAFRQSLAAHKLVATADGRPMLFAKENFSNGDIATVDVLYPSAPIFLFFNPRLLEAQVMPVLEYASMTNHWHFPFAPHDLGQYPLANGQEYGGGEKTEEDQMPVEESGNLLILVDAIARTEHKTALAEKYWPELTQWALFLKEHGLDPENQLTTDDFAGHVTHNANLALKRLTRWMRTPTSRTCCITRPSQRTTLSLPKITPASGSRWIARETTSSWPTTARAHGARSTT